MASSYGDKLNPDRHLRTPLGVRGKRQTVVITNNPSTIDASQQLLVRFPNLGANDVIVPGTARLSFTISLDSIDANRTVVQNLGRAVVKKLTIKISGNEVMSIDDSDLYYIYTDLWRSWTDRASADYQGIDTSLDRNTTKLRVGAADGNNGVPEDNAIANAYENRFYIPLDFELLESHMPYLQNALQEAKKLFAGGSKLPPDVSKVARSLDLHDMYLGAYLTNKYALWLDLRTTDDNELHGSGRRVENGSEGITLQITKTAEAPGALNVYIFIVMDAQLTINNGNFESAIY